MTSPAKRMRLSSQRQSLPGNRPNVTVTTPSQNALRNSTNAANRAPALSQSTSYDVIPGQPVETLPEKPRRPSISQSQNTVQGHPLRNSMSRPSMLPQPEKSVSTVSQQNHQEATLALQSRINKLEYEVRNLEGERGMLTLQHEKELRDVQARADVDYKKFQDAESERLKAVRQSESALKEVRDARERGVNESAAIERGARELQSQCDSLREEKQDLEGRLHDAEREIRRIQVEEVEAARGRLERTVQETTAELEEMKSRFETVNSKWQQEQVQKEALEKKVLELKGSGGGGEELEVLKREFSKQMEDNRQLKKLHQDQKARIGTLEDERRSVNVVLEEKRALEVQVRVLKDAERRAEEFELQKELLEDERRMWTSLLQNDSIEGQRMFDSPEAVIKALVEERIERAQLVEQLGSAQTEVVGKDEALRALESERDVLKAEVERAKETAAQSDASAAESSSSVSRLERQLQLAKKESDYLRDQLDTFNAMDLSLKGEAALEKEHADQVEQLNALIKGYQSEISSLNARITTLESQPAVPPSPLQLAGTKRKSEDSQSDELGKLQRKHKNLEERNKLTEDALKKKVTQTQMLATELQASRSQLKALRASAQTRVLELRDNPTAQHQAIKMETLRALKQENAELMIQLRGDTDAMSKVRVVPVSSVDTLKLDLQAKDTVIADREKKMRRQREIWTEKAAEFRDVISSVLGYKVTFLPNGKVKVRSMYYNPPKDASQEVDEEVAEEDREDYIEFDGDKGTMKIGGGRDGPFGHDVSEAVNYWVGEKKEIPCFLAAMTLEFYEKFGGMSEEATGPG